MIGLNIDKILKDVLDNRSLKIDTNHFNNICKIRQGEKTCRYIILGPQGFVCSKNTQLKQAIDQQCNKNQMTAKGDNCDGLGEDNASQTQESSEENQTQD